MLFIYRPKINLILRTVMKPFSSIIPSKYHIPVNGSFNIDLGEGKRINLLVNPTSFLGRLLFWKGVKGFEYKSVRVFIELAKKSEVFFDIGANIGYYSLVAAAFNNKLKIIGFEPSPSAFKFFKKNIENNKFKNIKLETTALSDSVGKTTFFAVKSKKFLDIPDHLNGDGTINLENVGSSLIEKFDVKTNTLDNYIRQNNISKIDLIKIDTEASEHLVFSAGHKVLKEYKPIVLCEVIPNKIEKELNEIFKDHRYLFYKAYPNGLKKMDNLFHKDASIDYFMVPESKGHLISSFIVA